MPCDPPQRPLLYLIENNGVYGLTKGQFSASADVGCTSKKRRAERQNQPIDPCLLALTLGATFVARSFSGDKAQLVPILKAGLRHNGFALIDVISPCVSFNDHEGVTKSYKYTREHEAEIAAADFVPLRKEISSPDKARRARVERDDARREHRAVPEDGRRDYDPRRPEGGVRARAVVPGRAARSRRGCSYIDENGQARCTR